MMRLALCLLLSAIPAYGFVSPRTTIRRTKVVELGKTSDELGIPCGDECSLPSYPKLPPSVHPGVVTGQALRDLLK